MFYHCELPFAAVDDVQGEGLVASGGWGPGVSGRRDWLGRTKYNRLSFSVYCQWVEKFLTFNSNTVNLGLNPRTLQLNPQNEGEFSKGFGSRHVVPLSNPVLAQQVQGAKSPRITAVSYSSSVWVDHWVVIVAGWLLSHVQLFVTPLTVACQAPQSMGFSRQEYWGGLPFPSPGDLPNPGIELTSAALQADSLALSHQGSPDHRVSRAIKSREHLFSIPILLLQIASLKDQFTAKFFQWRNSFLQVNEDEWELTFTEHLLCDRGPFAYCKVCNSHSR